MDTAEIYSNMVSAVRKGHLGKFQELLIKYGSDISKLKQNTLLHVAVEKGHENIVDFLLKNNTDINAKDENDKSVLLIAVEKGDLQIVTKLIKHGACVNLVCSSEVLAITPIHEAARAGHEGIIKLLLHSHADIEAKDVIGYTALHIAAQNGFLEIGKLLLSSGAVVDSNTVSKVTPLHVAVRCNHSDFVKLLLKYNANVNSTDICGETALHTAVGTDYVKIAGILLNCKADVHVKSHDGKTALHVAALLNKRDLGKILLDHGADPNTADSNGMTPLHRICMASSDVIATSGQKEFVELLLRYGADPNIICIGGQTPLNYAVESCQEHSIKLLLDFNADISLFVKSKQTIISNRLLKINSIFNEHLIKMKAATLDVNKENLQYFKYNNIDLNPFESLCEEEIELMKSVKIVNGTASLHDVLISNLNQVARYVCSEDAEVVVQHVDYESEFPIYAKMLRSKFSNGIQRKSLTQQFRHCHNNLLVLPEYCIDRITCYISHYDLLNLIQACRLDNADNLQTDVIKHTNFCDVSHRHILKKRKID